MALSKAMPLDLANIVCANGVGWKQQTKAFSRFKTGRLDLERSLVGRSVLGKFEISQDAIVRGHGDMGNMRDSPQPG